MKPALQLQFHDFDPSPALTELVHAELMRLWRHHPDVTSCHVTLGAPHRHHRHGRHYQIHMELHLPGGLLPVTHAPKVRPEAPPREEASVRGEDAYAAVRDAFEIARRKLDERARRQRTTARSKVRAVKLRQIET